jgi:catechol 2,3-dioxygenase-like lactoylglutathione lyase family enzyme
MQMLSKPLPKELSMKRFHVHAHVADLQASIAFYSKMFAAEPTRVESDYAKWMLDDPRVNFAISTRGGKPGVDHLGIQTDDAAELAELKARAQAADMALFDEGETTCCYARSEKHWVTDPQGIAWEHFHTLDGIPVFSEQQAAKADANACCAAPAAGRGKPIGIPVAPAASSCC